MQNNWKLTYALHALLLNPHPLPTHEHFYSWIVNEWMIKKKRLPQIEHGRILEYPVAYNIYTSPIHYNKTL